MCLVAAIKSITGGLVGVMTNCGPFWRKDFCAGDRGLLNKL